MQVTPSVSLKSWHLNLSFWILTTMSDIHNNHVDSSRSSPSCHPIGEPLCHDWWTGQLWHNGNLCGADVALWPSLAPCPMSLFVMLWWQPQSEEDLCLTNGSFIIPRATSMSPVFIALYFKLHSQQCTSIMVTRDLYWRWWLGPGEVDVQV